LTDGEYIAVEHSFHPDGRERAHSIVSFSLSFFFLFFILKRKKRTHRPSPTVWLLGREKKELRRHCLHVIHVLCLTSRVFATGLFTLSL
jgi:hypothetical protein